MKYSTQIKPIIYLKVNAAEIVRNLAEQREPLVISQNGEAKAVIQDVASYEETQETLVLLKILALGDRQIEEGRTVSAKEALKRLREKRSGAADGLRGTADRERRAGSDEICSYIRGHAVVRGKSAGTPHFDPLTAGQP